MQLDLLYLSWIFSLSYHYKGFNYASIAATIYTFRINTSSSFRKRSADIKQLIYIQCAHINNYSCFARNPRHSGVSYFKGDLNKA